MKQLFHTKRFLPLFVTQFLGATNDNLFKNALTILVIYSLAAHDDKLAGELVNWIAALFILPFLLFSASAGSLADRMDKAVIARSTKIAELALTAFAAIALWSGNLYFLLAVIFGFGVQSAFFGPVKYALLPQQLKENELVAANGYIEAATFLAILLGTIIGGVVVLQQHGINAIILLMSAIALAGYIASRSIPPAPPKQHGEAISLNPVSQTINITRYTYKQKDLLACIIAITWFWVTGVVALTQLPALSKQFFHSDEYVTTFFLTLFSIGIGVGSMMCQRLLHNTVRADISPLGGVGMAFFLCVIYVFTPTKTEATSLLSLAQFLQQDFAPYIIIGFVGAAVCGGIYVVPLYALLQQRASPDHRARIIASNNIFNSAGMTIASLTAVALLHFDFTVPQLLLILGVLNIFMAFYCARLATMPLQAWIWKLLYRVRVNGTENLRGDNERIIIVANHASFLDALLLYVLVSRDLVFVHGGATPWRPWMRPFIRGARTHLLDPDVPESFETLLRKIRSGERCVIFPEGLPATGNALEKMDGSAALLAENANARLLPVRIEGAQYTPFSRLRNGARMRLFPKITLTLLPPQRLQLPRSDNTREHRQSAATHLYRFMCEAMFIVDLKPSNLVRELLEARRTHGGGRIILEDMQGTINYRSLVAKSIVLGRLLARAIAPEQKRIGLMLPNSIGAAVTFFALLGIERTAAMMNFSAGPAQITSACRTAGVKTVLTSRRFVELAKLEPIVESLEASNIKVIHLERLRGNLRTSDKFVGLIGLVAPRVFLRKALGAHADEEVVTLFTSGSEGAPKGVVLSHNNVIANLRQFSVVEFGPRDIVFSCLPMFHSFGLTVGMMLPVFLGLRTYMYPSPLHYSSIPELLYRTGTTMFFGTDTFLRGYARFAHPYDFHALRYIFAGAEKLHEETRKFWLERFGVRILQGYGVTETAPVISVNTPMENRAGTVGRALPGIEVRLESEPDLHTGKRLYVRGANIMLGYMKENAPERIQPPPDGWHDTGDIATIDDDGFITIVDRFGRFAKIGGEMVSLGAVEAVIGGLWRDVSHTVVAVPDAERGESLVLLTLQPDANVAALGEHFQRMGLARLWIPRVIFTVEEAPLLPSGKTDYVKAHAMAMKLTGQKD